MKYEGGKVSVDESWCWDVTVVGHLWARWHADMLLTSVLSCSFTPILMQSNQPLHTILADFHRIINHYLILSIFPPTLALTSFSHHRDIYASFSKTLLFSPSPQPQKSSNCIYINFPKTLPTQMVEVGLVAPNEVLLQRESQWPPGTLWSPRPGRRPCTTLAGWGAGWVLMRIWIWRWDFIRVLYLGRYSHIIYIQ